MGGSGYATNTFIIGKNHETGADVTDAGVRTHSSSMAMIPLPKKILTANVAYQLPNIPSVLVHVRAGENNIGKIFYGGAGRYIAQVDHGTWLYAAEPATFNVENANELSFITDISNQELYVSVETSSESDIGEADSLTIDVSDTTAPTVVSTDPASAAVNVAWNKQITATFDEAIDPTSVNTSSFTISPSPGGVAVGVDATDSLKVYMNHNNLSSATVYTMTLKGTGSNKIADLAGNTLAADYTWTFTSNASAPASDVTAPTIYSRNPISNQTDVDPALNPVVVFNEPMLSSSINTTTMQIKNESTGSNISYTISLAADLQTATIIPESVLDNGTRYKITVIGGSSGVKDLAGNALASTSTWIYATRAETYTSVYNVAHNNKKNTLGNDAGLRVGFEITSSSNVLYNQKPKRIILRMRKQNSPTGTMTVTIRDSSKNLKFTYLQTLDVSTITTDTNGSVYTFSDASVQFMASALAVGDTMLLEYDGDNTNYVEVWRNENNIISGINEVEFDSSLNKDSNTSYDVAWQVFV